MNVGAFVCACGETNRIDLEGVREGVTEADVVASSSHLCTEGTDAMAQVIEEYDLDHLVVTAPDECCRDRLRAVVAEQPIHPDAVSFVDHREGAGWVHDRDAATGKTARIIDATTAGCRHEPVSRTVARDAGDEVVVVGDAAAAAALADGGAVTLVADGREFADADADLSDVRLERGRVVDVDGAYGEFDVRLRARVTEDCIGCLDCVREGPDGAVTSRPVDVAPDAPDGAWIDCCPVDAIDPDGVERVVTADQVVHPGADGPRGGRLGVHTTADGDALARVERLRGGIEKPNHLDLNMGVCAAGGSSQEGCTACTDACPHGAVARPAPDEVAFDEVACQDCGACTSACPTGAVTLREPSNERLAREAEALLDGGADPGRIGRLFGDQGGIGTPVVAFVCSERAADALRSYGRRAGRGEDVSYPPILPVRVNCTDTVGEGHVLHALAAGADGVAVVGCGEACLHSGPAPKADLVDRLNRATRDLGLGERVAFLAPERDDPAAFADALAAFVSGLDASPVPAGEHEATGTARPDSPRAPFSTHDWVLESVRTIAAHADPEREVIRGIESAGRLDVDDACALTPTCTTLCPTDAIRRTADGDLQFNHADCVNCGLCETGCPENAIAVEAGLDRSRIEAGTDAVADSWETVYDGDVLECVRCGSAFTSVESMEAVREKVGDLVEGVAPDAEHSIFEYCDDCRSRIIYEGGA